jgi:circadian clock protein KaiC
VAKSEIERLSSGVEGLDTVLNGGLVRGAAYIINGPPGAGKTILSNQFCFHHARAGRKALYMSLLAEAHDRMLAYMSSMDFFDPNQVPERLYYMSAFSTLQNEGLAGVQKLVNSEIRRHKAEAVVVDGLFVIRETAVSEAEFRQFVHELQGQASITGATILLLTNQSRRASSPEHTMVDGWIEIMDELDGARAVRSLVVRKQRGSGFPRGRHEFRITDQGVQVFPRLESILPVKARPHASMARVGTGIAALDTALGGGYPANSTTVLMGPSGIGKTTFGIQFLADCTPERPGLLFGFYETPERLRAKAKSLGFDFDALVNTRALDIVWQPPVENLADELGQRLLAHAKAIGAKRVFVDGIAGFELALLFPERLSMLLNVINHTLESAGVTVVYAMETGHLHLSDELDIFDLSAMVDNVIRLHYEMRSGTLRRHISVLKVRDSDFEPFPQEFHIAAQGVVLAARPDGWKRGGGGVARRPGGRSVKRAPRSKR